MMSNLQQLRVFFSKAVYIHQISLLLTILVIEASVPHVALSAPKPSLGADLTTLNANGDPVKIVNGKVWGRFNPESGEAVLGAPITRVENDPLIMAPDARFQGLLAYTFSFDEKRIAYNYIVICNTTKNTRIVYPIQVKDNAALEPQLSPDGSALLVKVGTLETRWPRYRLYVLDLHTGGWKKIPSGEINFPEVAWSPDSRSVAFVEGGNIFGEETKEPLRLMVCQWQEGKTRVVDENKGVVGGFCFASPDTILYSRLPPGQPQTNDNRSPKAPQPEIYEAKEGAAPRPLLRFAHRPNVSPDGKHIAFYGAENVQHPSALAREWWSDPQGSSLCVANIDGKERRALTLQRGLYAPLLWPQEKDHLWSLDQTQTSPHARYILKSWDLQNGQWNSKGELRSEDSQTLSFTENDPQVRLCGQPEKDGSFFFASAQAAGSASADKFTVLRSIQRFDVPTGKTTLIAQVQNKEGDSESIGIDWCPLSDTNP